MILSKTVRGNITPLPFGGHTGLHPDSPFRRHSTFALLAKKNKHGSILMGKILLALYRGSRTTALSGPSGAALRKGVVDSVCIGVDKKENHYKEKKQTIKILFCTVNSKSIHEHIQRAVHVIRRRVVRK